jgi:phosphoenolpyruvate carboxykinase (ATP)
MFKNEEVLRSELAQYGINDVRKIFHNSSYEELYQDETAAGLEGFEKGFVTDMGAVSVDTGVFTGRSPKDKYIVYDDVSKDTVWWSTQGKNDNRPLEPSKWDKLKSIAS